MRFWLLLVAIGTMLFAFVPVSQSNAQPQNDLIGSQWQLTSYGEPGDETPVIETTTVTLEFLDANQAVGDGGCNQYGATYEIDNDAITFTEIISTEMACLEDGVMEQEQAFFAALQAATRYEVTDEQLTIWYGDEQQLVFTRTAGLVGTQWQLVSYGDETPVLPDSSVTLEFIDTFQAGGFGGCNHYGSSYEIEDDTITFTDVFSTLMACLDDDVMQQEQLYFSALQAATHYEVTDDQLTIWYGSDDEQLVFNRADALVDTRWELVSYGEVGDETPVVPESTVTLEFLDANQAGGFGGCNSYGANYETEDGSITFTEIVSTLVACLDGAIMQQEQLYFVALEAATHYEIFDDQLTIWYGENHQLVFTRAQEDPSDVRTAP